MTKQFMLAATSFMAITLGAASAAPDTTSRPQRVTKDPTGLMAVRQNRSYRPTAQDIQGFHEQVQDRMNPIRLPVRVSVPTPDEVLAAEIFSAAGEPVEDRLLVDEVSGHIVGTVLPDVSLGLTRVITNAGDEPAYVLGAQSQDDGSYVDIDAEDMVLVDKRYDPQCFDLESVLDTAQPVTAHLVVDVSGSMSRHLSDVMTAATAFIKQLPEKAQCQIQLFGTHSEFVQPEGSSVMVKHRPGNVAPPSVSCMAFLEETNTLDSVINSAAGGGTDISGALSLAYDAMADRPETMNIIMALTDGLDAWSTATHDELLAKRALAVKQSGLLTAVQWLGDFNQLSQAAVLADHSYVGIVPGQPAGHDLLTQAVGLLEHQVVMQETSCK